MTFKATIEQIAEATGKSKATVQRMAEKNGWGFEEIESKGRHKKRVYLSEKLPQDIQLALVGIEKKTGDENGQATSNEEINNLSSIYPAVCNNQRESTANTADGQEQCDYPQQLPESNGGRSADVVRSYQTQGRKLVTDGGRFSSKPGYKTGLPATDDGSSLTLAQFTESQRSTHLSINIVMDYLKGHGGGLAQAIVDFNSEFKSGTVPEPVLKALGRCLQKDSGVKKSEDILKRSTVYSWDSRFKSQGNYIPMTRIKDMEIKPWHHTLVELVAMNKQQRDIKWMWEQLVIQHPGVTYRMVTNWLRDKYSESDKMKGKHSGIQLWGKQAYQRRTSKGMTFGQEVHADGWNTHCTAPHPITGEYVTFEIWDFHDVASRYVPPFGIGLTENFEVIAKGMENAIRDMGVMSILQTDSTKIIKLNKKFVGDPLLSIGERAGITIVHPKRVGNAMTNGISENFHVWMDREAKELGTYQAKNMDSLTLRNVKRITAKMVKAKKLGDQNEFIRLHKEAERVSGGIVFTDYQQMLDWLELKREKWNRKPHGSLPKVVDEETDNLRHMTPMEYRAELEAEEGFVKYQLDEALLQDLFRVRVIKKVSRHMVKPYGNMFFEHESLPHYEGQEVVIAYDIMDYKNVWVYDLKGSLICIATFKPDTGYRSQSAYEAANEKRAKAQIKGLEKKIELIEARNKLNDDFIDSSTVVLQLEDKMESGNTIAFFMKNEPDEEYIEESFNPNPNWVSSDDYEDSGTG